MNLRRVNLNLLPYFEALYTERNLTAAAERMAVSQPTMSNALARMRATFNDQLFIRVGHSMEPTPRAKRIASEILVAMESVRKSVTDDRQFDHQIPRTFNLAGIDHLGLFGLPELIKRNKEYLQTLHFNNIALSESGNLERLRSGDLDLIVDVSQSESEELCSECILEDSLVLMIRKEHPLAGKPVSEKQMRQLQFVIFSSRINSKFVVMEKLLTDQGYEEQIAVRANQVISLDKIIRSTDLAGFVPEAMIEHPNTGLVKLQTPFASEVQIMHFMTWHELQNNDPGNCWLRNEIREIYQHPFKL